MGPRARALPPWRSTRAAGRWGRRRRWSCRRRSRGLACRRERALSPGPAQRSLVVGGVAELLLADDDAAKEAVRRMLLGEGDPAEHLHRPVGHLPGGARYVCLGHGGRFERVL